MTRATTTCRRTLGAGCAGLLAAATLLAACSSSSSGNPISAGLGAGGGSSSGSSSTAAAPPATTSTAAAGGGQTSTAAKAATTSKSKAGSTGGGLSLGSGSFCDVAKNAQAEQDKMLSSTSDSPASLKQLELEDAKLLPQFVAIAPAAIKPDIEIIVAADQQVVAALEKVNWDVSKLSPTTIDAFETPAFTKATDAATAYLEKNCGIKPSS